jgi:hypothetical protein
LRCADRVPRGVRRALSRGPMGLMVAIATMRPGDPGLGCGEGVFERAPGVRAAHGEDDALER